MATTSLDAATAQALLNKFAPVIWLHSQRTTSRPASSGTSRTFK
jgi:hypothetical protein